MLSSTPEPDHHLQAIEECRKLWYSFVNERAKREIDDLHSLQKNTAEVARCILSRDQKEINFKQIRIHPTTQRLLNFVTAMRGDHPNVQRPLVTFHQVSMTQIKQTAEEHEDQEAATKSDDRPASWLYQHRWKGGKYRIPTIVVDSRYIEDFLNSSTCHHEIEKKAYITCLVLKELMHYLMHWDRLQPDDDDSAGNEDDRWATMNKETNQFRPAKWASLDEEEEAWIGCHLLIGLATSAIARDTRSDGQFDGAWKYSS